MVENNKLEIAIEKKVLSAMAMDQAALCYGINNLCTEDFIDGKHQIIFSAISALENDDVPICPASIGNELKKHGNLEKAGGIKYLESVLQSEVTSTRIEYHVKMLKEKSGKRHFKKSIRTLYEESDSDNTTTGELIEKTQKILDQHDNAEKRSEGFELIRPAVFECLQEIENSKKTMTRPGISTGYQDLDKLIQGFEPGNLYILAARPGEGKTALALNIALKMASRIEDPANVAICSLEMTKSDLLKRLFAMRSGINSYTIRDAIHLTNSNLTKLQDAANTIGSLPIWINADPGISGQNLKRKIKIWRNSIQGLGILIVDYLQLLPPGTGFQNREQEVAEITRALKSISMEMQIPVLALSQLNREIHKRHDRKPLLSDLRESGAIEQAASVVGFIYTPDPQNPEDVRLLIEKNRHGEKGEVAFFFQKSTQRFLEFSSSTESAVAS